jgi:hypothetical protein
MATENFVQIPDDSANAGKKIRTVQRIVGSNTVNEHVVITSYPHDIKGLYYASTGPFSIVTTAHSATAGFVWLINPVGSPVTVAIRRIRSVVYPTTSSTHSSVPLCNLERMTFTGSASGGTVTPAKRRTADEANVATMRVASTGISITPGAVIREFIVPLVPSGGGNISSPFDVVFEPIAPEGELELAAGEGLVVRQDANGEATDDRRIKLGFTWLEF